MSAVYQMVTDRVIAKLEQGVVPWSCPWARSETSPRSLVSQKPYRGINAMLTAMSGYRSPYWLTYKQALDLGANVREGEKSTPIVFWGKIEKQDASGKESDREISFLRYYSAFNVEQIDNLRIAPEKLFPNVKQIDFEPIEKAESIVAGMPQRPDIQHVKQSAFYYPELDYVNMPQKDSFRSREEYYSTLFHELTHSTGHESRLNRKTLSEINRFGDHSYSKEELVAEMGSAFLCSIAGIEQVFENQAAYIAGWLKKLRNDPKMVIQAAGQAQKAAEFVLNVKEGAQ